MRFCKCSLYANKKQIIRINPGRARLVHFDEAQCCDAIDPITVEGGRVWDAVCVGHDVNVNRMNTREGSFEMPHVPVEFQINGKFDYYFSSALYYSSTRCF